MITALFLVSSHLDISLKVILYSLSVSEMCVYAYAGHFPPNSSTKHIRCLLEISAASTGLDYFVVRYVICRHHWFVFLLIEFMQ